MREGIKSKTVAQLQPGDVLHGSGDTIVSVTVNRALKDDPRKAVVVITHPKYGRRIRFWNKTTSVGVVSS